MLNLLTFAMLIVSVSFAADEPSKSASLAATLADLMQRHKLESVAVRDAQDPDRFSAAMAFPGQLLIVSARYAAPVYLREHLLKRNYKDVYVQLSTSGDPAGKFFVQDLGADGLRPTRTAGVSFDTVYRAVTERMAFDGDWRSQKLSESEYHERFTSADQEYAALLEALIGEARKAAGPQ
jgi:hypothetical protein